MAPKKSKGKGKGKLIESTRPEDERFVCKEAKERWDQVSSLPFIYEWGFLMEKRKWSEALDNQIQAMGWNSLCHPRSEAVLPCVYEFYANVKFSEGENVMVRGRMVSYSAEAINALFDLDNAAMDPFARLQSCAAHDEVAVMLCGGMVPEWAQKLRKALKSMCLSRETKVWLLFINASLAPTCHLNLITWNRMTVVYAIFKGIKFNVGILININLKAKIYDDKAKYLWFPILITELCKSTGVEVHDGDVTTHVSRHITKTVVQVNIKVAKEDPTKKKKPTTLAPDQYTRPSPRSPGHITLEDGPSAETMRNLEYLKAYHRHQHVYFDQRLDYICVIQAQLMHKAKLRMPTPSYCYSGNFDKRGYLMTTGRTRLDPAYEDDDSDDIPEEYPLADYLDEDDEDEDDDDVDAEEDEDDDI